ncbi:MAG: hypothetical protein II510_08905 [Erysipelotrichales bacterium]|nr:hypothetical protein [Erysipelotrichales bacterium]
MKDQGFGGYLPLEIPQTGSLFEQYGAENVYEVNTGRTAIWCALKNLGVNKTVIPFYYCPDIKESLEKEGVEVREYRVGMDMMPINLTAGEDEAVILVNYYGILTEKIRKLAEQYPKVIIDQAHGYYSEPFLREGVMNVYSCRKFLGVSDGGYLIGKNLIKPELEKDVSWQRTVHLVRSVEEGTEAAYAESKVSESELDSLRTMSEFTRRILAGADYPEIKKRRQENFRFLEEEFRGIQQLHIGEPESVPYMYPLLLGRDIHRELVKEKVYVPYLWAPLLTKEWEGSAEQILSKNIVPLPLDQRYNTVVLHRMVQTVKGILNR